MKAFTFLAIICAIPVYSLITAKTVMEAIEPIVIIFIFSVFVIVNSLERIYDSLNKPEEKVHENK